MQLNVSCRVWSEFIAFLVSWRSSSTTAERWLNDASTFRASRLPYHTSRKLCCGCKSERRKTLPINFQLRLTRSRKNSRQLFLNKSLIMCCDKWFFAKKFPSLSHQLQVFTEARSRSHRANEKKSMRLWWIKMKNFFHIESEGRVCLRIYYRGWVSTWKKRHFSTFSGAPKMRNKLLWINALFRIQKYINSERSRVTSDLDENSSVAMN